MNIVPEMDDLELHVSDEDCARFAEILDTVKVDEETKKMMDQIDADLEKTLFPDLRVITNMPDATTEDMHNVCNYIVWAKANYIELSFTRTED